MKISSGIGINSSTRYSVFYLFLVMVVSISFVLTGCNKSVTPELIKADLRIDVETDFHNDYVKVYLDNNILLNERITTNYSISAAWLSGNIETTEGYHKIRFEIVNTGAAGSYLVKAGELITVQINYLRQKNEITFSQYKGIIFRD